MWYYILPIVLGGLLLLVLLGALICFFMVFYSPKRKAPGKDEYELPDGEIYEEFREKIIGWARMSREMAHKDFEITSFDGLTLRGKYYECDPDGPVELLFHGYRGNAERDMSGGIARCFALGRNALIIDHRASGFSQGHVITFGIKEHKDCLSWVEFAINHFGPEKKLILTGISMGAATVMIAAGTPLPPSVVCVLADCGYTSAKEIIEKIIKDLRLPRLIIYPLIKIGARIFGGFDLEEFSPKKAMEKATVPIILIHGDTDAFVPCQMSGELYELCKSEHKKIVYIEGAGHGLAFPKNQEKYLNSLSEFQKECNF